MVQQLCTHIENTAPALDNRADSKAKVQTFDKILDG